jgi:hypothetical protein
MENFRLRVFRSVARHLNFRIAAEELLLTQSAVTQQIKALEAGPVHEWTRQGESGHRRLFPTRRIHFFSSICNCRGTGVSIATYLH